MTADANGAEAPSIFVKDLSYKFADGSAGLHNVSLDLPPHSRTLLIGGSPALPRLTCTRRTKKPS